MKIATLSTYPISTPYHGGQRRVDAIVQGLRRAGHDVLHIPVFFLEDFPEATDQERQTGVSSTLCTPLAQSGKRQDVHLQDVLKPDHPAVQKTIALLGDFAPDFIQFESPWLYPVVQSSLENHATLSDVPLVYSSQNIETHLLPDAHKPDARALEKALVAASAKVFAVSAADAKVFRKWGAGDVVVAPNGANPPPATLQVPTRVIAEPYALFVGSGHGPNAEGYWNCFGTVPGFIPPSARLVVAGGVNNLLGADTRFSRFRALNTALVHNTGVVSEAVLENLLHYAGVICLPVLSGGGTNLKTAEALLSDKPIIATPQAFRGFETHTAAPGVHIQKTPQMFRQCLREFFTTGLPGTRDPATLQDLTWSASISPIVATYGDGTHV